MKMNWNFNRDTVATAVKLPPIPLRLTYPQQQSVKDTRKTVFHRDEKRDKTSARTSKINLEDFVERDNVTVQPMFEELSMELKLNEMAEQTSSENVFNYRRALHNVKRALPNLRVVRFSGQHYYYPVNGTAEKMRNELHLVQNALQAITHEMRNLNLRGDNDKPLRYELYLVFDKKFVKSHQFQRYVNDVFGHSNDVQLSCELRSLVVRTKMNGTECQLTFHFFTELQMLNDLHGFLIHDRMGGSEALSRMLALTLELKLANEKFENKNLKFY